MPDVVFSFDNTYARDLEGFYARSNAERVPAPKLIKLNQALAKELGLDTLNSQSAADIFSGNEAPQGAEVLAQAYAGHQFGNFVPQLGDGRALLLGELIDTSGNRRDIQLKGSGRTPFSRGGDGKAAIGPVLREYLMGEAMHALGIPTTRALAAVSTGQPVFRERPLPGAVLTRVAASHIRVGTFQFFASRGDYSKVKQLADYTIARHDPALATTPNPYLAFLNAVCDRQAALIASWMHVGFIHGVMNTDNMAISGETIDYGPCAFMDRYSPRTVFSSIDHQGRYAYGNQPIIARWNLARLAETLLPLISTDESTAVAEATAAVNSFTDRYDEYWLQGMRTKLGLADPPHPEDLNLANGFLSAMDSQSVDYTLAFRALAQAALGDDGKIRILFEDPAPYDVWAEQWRNRKPDATTILKSNPLYVPRNHMVEAALTAATEQNDLAPFETLLEVLSLPFTERPGFDAYTKPAALDAEPYRTFCGT